MDYKNKGSNNNHIWSGGFSFGDIVYWRKIECVVLQLIDLKDPQKLLCNGRIPIATFDDISIKKLKKKRTSQGTIILNGRYNFPIVVVPLDDIHIKNKSKK